MVSLKVVGVFGVVVKGVGTGLRHMYPLLPGVVDSSFKVHAVGHLVVA